MVSVAKSSGDMVNKESNIGPEEKLVLREIANVLRLSSSKYGV